MYREVPDGHQVGWDHSAVPEVGLAPLDANNEPESGWEGDVPVGSNESSVVEADEIMPVPDVGSRDPEPVVDERQPSRDERSEGMHELLRCLGGVPDAIAQSSSELISTYLHGRLQSGVSGS